MDNISEPLAEALRLLEPHVEMEYAVELAAARQVVEQANAAGFPSGRYKIYSAGMSVGYAGGKPIELLLPPRIVNDKKRMEIERADDGRLDEGYFLKYSVKGGGQILAKLIRNTAINDEPRPVYQFEYRQSPNFAILDQLMEISDAESEFRVLLQSLRKDLQYQVECEKTLMRTVLDLQKIDRKNLKPVYSRLSRLLKEAHDDFVNSRKESYFDQDFWENAKIPQWPAKSVEKAGELYENARGYGKERDAENFAKECLKLISKAQYRPQEDFLPADNPSRKQMLYVALRELYEFAYPSQVDFKFMLSLVKSVEAYDAECARLPEYCATLGEKEAFGKASQINSMRFAILEQVQAAIKTLGNPSVPVPGGESLAGASAGARRMLVLLAQDIAWADLEGEKGLLAQGEGIFGAKWEQAAQKYIQDLAACNTSTFEFFRRSDRTGANTRRAARNAKIEKLIQDMEETMPVLAEALRREKMKSETHIMYKFGMPREIKAEQVFTPENCGEVTMAMSYTYLHGYSSGYKPSRDEIDRLGDVGVVVEGLLTRLYNINNSVQDALIRIIGKERYDDIARPKNDPTLHRIERDVEDQYPDSKKMELAGYTQQKVVLQAEAIKPHDGPAKVVAGCQEGKICVELEAAGLAQGNPKSGLTFEQNSLYDLMYGPLIDKDTLVSSISSSKNKEYANTPQYLTDWPAGYFEQELRKGYGSEYSRINQLHVPEQLRGKISKQGEETQECPAGMLKEAVPELVRFYQGPKSDQKAQNAVAELTKTSICELFKRQSNFHAANKHAITQLVLMEKYSQLKKRMPQPLF